MKRLILLLITAFSIVCFTETNQIRDFVLIECDSGLSNRLRLLATFMYLKTHVFVNISHIVMVWDVNESCRGHILQTFQAVKDVVFITGNDRPLFERFAKKSYYNTDAPIHKILSWHNVTVNDDELLELQRSAYSQFVPVEDIKKAVHDYVNGHKICESTAIHIRRTDMDAHPVFLHKYTKNHTSDNEFVLFIESLPADEKVFLLTDNHQTQRELLSRFGPEKILVYHIINHHQTSNQTYDLHHRFTSFQITVMDILIAAHSKRFKGTFFSSMSELISVLRDVNIARHICSQSTMLFDSEGVTVNVRDRT